MKAFRCLSVGILLFLALSQAVGALPSRAPLEMSVEVIVNPKVESSRPGCAVPEGVRAFGKRVWWVAIGEAESDPQEDRKAVSSQIRCEQEPADNVSPAPETSAPYVIARIETISRIRPWTLTPERLVVLDIKLSVQKRSGFSETRKPIYQETEEVRNVGLVEGEDLFIPIFVANEAEREQLAIAEVLLRFAIARSPEPQTAAYGVLSVTSGVEGGKVLLDGGVAGTVSGGGETTFRNVPAGVHSVGLRDAAGHEIKKAVRVEANRTTVVDLSFPDPTRKAAPFTLWPLGPNAQGYEEYEREADGAVVVKIPAGEFLMGNKETERTPFEHRVYVSEFLMDKLGVTWAQYKRFAAATGIPLPPRELFWGMHDDHPAVFVTWEESKAYCEWAGGRLPTEAEREKAARGTDSRKYPWGDEEPTPELGVFRRAWGFEGTAAVGTHPAGSSPYGLEDMGGNVWEWCSDWYDGDYYEVSPYKDPRGPTSGTAHVLRGGSWDSRPTVLSASCRNWGSSGYREGDFGFRCVMNAPRVDEAAN